MPVAASRSSSTSTSVLSSTIVSSPPGSSPPSTSRSSTLPATSPGPTRALAARGIDDPSLVHVEAWSVGSFEDSHRRLVRALSWLGTGDEADNQYARPLAGLIAVVDLNALAVVRIDDHAPGSRPPTAAYPYHDGAGGRRRDDLRPLEITQPSGPSFTIDGDRVLRWQKWEMLVGRRSPSW
jgi:primary-amine oxidase